MDDVFAVQKTQTLDQRLGEPLDQIEAEALVVVFLNQLVQVETATWKKARFEVNWPRTRAIRMQPHELERDAQVVSEVKVLEHVDYIVSAVTVLLAQVV